MKQTVKFAGLAAVALSCAGCGMPSFYDRPQWSLFDKAEVNGRDTTQVANSATAADNAYGLGGPSDRKTAAGQ